MEAGHRVCLLEADPLGTVSNWRRRRTSAEPTVEIIHDGYMLFHRVQALAHRGITLTIVDTAGGWSDACTGAMAAADLCHGGEHRRRGVNVGRARARREAAGKLFADFVKPHDQGGLCGIKFSPEQTLVVGETLNIQWKAEAEFLAEPYKGSDAYETHDGLMAAMVSTFKGADLKVKK